MQGLIPAIQHAFPSIKTTFMPHKTIPHLPAELIDTIIDHLHDEKAALATCSLVCKGWLPSSRHHLFKSLELQKSNIESNVDGFLEMRESPLCTVLPHIRELTVTGLGTIFSQLSADKISSSFAGLHSVATLSIDYTFWVDMNSKSRAAFCACFPLTKELWIRDVSSKRFQTIVDIVCAFPSLQSLTLRSVSWSVNGAGLDLSPECSLPSHLRNVQLSISDAHRKDVLAWFLAQKSMPSLRYLDLQEVRPKEAASVDACLKGLGSSLEELRASFVAQNNDHHEEINLQHNTSLRSIDVDNHLFEDPRSTSFNWIRSILSTANSPDLTQINFRTKLRALSDLDHKDTFHDWEAFDDLFARGPQYKHLQRLIFGVCGSVKVEDVEKEFKKRLPGCTSRGVLWFTPGFGTSV